MGGWYIGLFECNQNLSTFFFACFVPGSYCCIQMVNSRTADRDASGWKIACLLACCLPILGCIINRYNLRKILDIEDLFLLDCIFWLYCPVCAVTQEYLETLEKKNNGEKGTKIWQMMNRK